MPSTGTSSFCPGFRSTPCSTGAPGCEAIMVRLLQTGLPSAGIFIGPAAWLLNQEVNYALVPWICAHQVRLVPLVALVAVIISLAGGLLSWRAFQHSSITPEPDSTGAGRPHRFT